MTEAIAEARNSAVLESIMSKLEEVEAQLAQAKKLEMDKKELQEELRQRMEEYGIDKWEMPNGTKVALVKAIPPSETVVTKFDEAAFKLDDPDTYDMYCKKTIKKDRGRKGYVRITVPKATNE